MDAVTGYSGMRRVLVIGCPGAGKSTFARRLRDATGLPLHYLDMLWHNPDRTTVTRAEFDERLQRILEEDAWILDGNFARTLPKRLEYCDTVFFLNFPTDVCLEGVEGRSGMKREDMPWVEHEFDEESSVSTSSTFPLSGVRRWLTRLKTPPRAAVCVSIRSHPGQSWCKRSLMF